MITNPTSTRLPHLCRLVTLLAVVWLVGCDTTREQNELDRQHQSDLLGANQPRVRPDTYEDTPADAASTRSDARVDLPSRAALPSRGPRAGRTSLASQLDKKGSNPLQELKVQLNFDADTMPTVVEAFSLLLGFQYYIDPAVQGKVTLRIDTEMNRTQVWELMEHILWLGGAYISPDDGFAHVMPFAKMTQERRLFELHPPQANVEVRVVHLNVVPAATIASAIQPFMTTGATATVVPHLNAVLLVEAPANVPKLVELIGELDQLGETRWPQISMPLEHVDPKLVIDELAMIMPILGIPVSTGGARSDTVSVKLAALPRLQTIVASAPSSELLDEIHRWVRVLDREDSKDVERIFFYDVKYNDASDLAEAITTFFSDAQSTRQSGNRSDTKAPDAPELTNRTAALSDDTGLVFSTPVRIFIDTNHNRLVVRTSPRAYATVDALLHRLDTPPLQVLIQVSIAEISLTKNTEFGFAYAWQKAIGGNVEVDSDLTASGATNIANLIIRSATDPTAIFGQITAVAGKGNTRVLFAPQVMVINGEEAVINVGDEVPVVTQENNSNNAETISRSIQFRSTGTILTVTPHITAEHMVRLELNQEVSDAVRTTSSDIDSPTIQTRNLKSTLLIEDGTTLLLGGLISSRDVDSDSGLPYVKDIPGIGIPFKNQKSEKSRRELLLLLTVHVVELDSDVQQLVKRYRAAIEAFNTSPVAPSAPVRDGSQAPKSSDTH